MIRNKIRIQFLTVLSFIPEHGRFSVEMQVKIYTTPEWAQWTGVDWVNWGECSGPRLMVGPADLQSVGVGC